MTPLSNAEMEARLIAAGKSPEDAARIAGQYVKEKNSAARVRKPAPAVAEVTTAPSSAPRGPSTATRAKPPVTAAPAAKVDAPRPAPQAATRAAPPPAAEVMSGAGRPSASTGERAWGGMGELREAEGRVDLDSARAYGDYKAARMRLPRRPTPYETMSYEMTASPEAMARRAERERAFDEDRERARAGNKRVFESMDSAVESLRSGITPYSEAARDVVQRGVRGVSGAVADYIASPPPQYGAREPVIAERPAPARPAATRPVAASVMYKDTSSAPYEDGLPDLVRASLPATLPVRMAGTDREVAVSATRSSPSSPSETARRKAKLLKGGYTEDDLAGADIDQVYEEIFGG